MFSVYESAFPLADPELPDSPVGAVGVAQVTHATGICKLPDQGAVLSRDSSRAGLDAVRAIDVVGTLHTAAWPLHRGRKPFHQSGIYVCVFQNEATFYLKYISPKKKKIKQCRNSSSGRFLL